MVPSAIQTRKSERPALRSYSTLECHYLERLKLLEEMRRELDASPITDPLPRRLVGRGVFSALRACESLGVGVEARRILGRE